MDMNQPRLIKRRTSRNADPGVILIKIRKELKMETFANFDKLSQSELVTICGGKVSTTTTTTTTTTTDGEGHSHTTTTTTTTTTITDD